MENLDLIYENKILNGLKQLIPCKIITCQEDWLSTQKLVLQGPFTDENILPQLFKIVVDPEHEITYEDWIEGIHCMGGEDPNVLGFFIQDGCYHYLVVKQG